ncbi:hypothetical protein AURANDRAFT_35111, partial [Aureococcus anophagefferens]
GDLDARVSEGGANLSCGERQLLCFARVLLRSACVVLLDADADAQVRAVIRAEIRGRSTMVVLAHRIKTIRHADLVLVLGDGRVAEFGAPADLDTPQSPHQSSSISPPPSSWQVQIQER